VREDGTFSREDFTFSKEGNVYICPAFKILTTTGKIMNDDMLFYRASTRDCAACAFKARCCPKEPARKILRSIYEEARTLAKTNTSSLPPSEADTSVDEGGGGQRLTLGRPSTWSVGDRKSPEAVDQII